MHSALSSLLRFPDLLVLALALPVFIIAGLPLAAYGVVAVLWLAVTVASVYVDRKIDASTTPAEIVGLSVGSALARVFVCAAGVLTVGVTTDDQTGLAAVILVMVLFTVYIINKTMTHFIASLGETL